jgi:hypothetical protein
LAFYDRALQNMSRQAIGPFIQVLIGESAPTEYQCRSFGRHDDLPLKKIDYGPVLGIFNGCPVKIFQQLRFLLLKQVIQPADSLMLLTGNCIQQLPQVLQHPFRRRSFEYIVVVDEPDMQLLPDLAKIEQEIEFATRPFFVNIG